MPLRRMLSAGVAVLLLGGAAACNGGASADTVSAESSSGSAAAPSTATTPPKALKFDCSAVLPRTKALVGLGTISANVYNPPGTATMPTSEQEWSTKDLHSYPGTLCGFATTGDTDSIYGIEIYAPGDWYRDNQTFGPPLPVATCTPATLTGAVKARWCASDAAYPVYDYSADLGVALVDVNLALDPALASIPSDRFKTAIEADLAELQFG